MWGVTEIAGSSPHVGVVMDSRPDSVLFEWLAVGVDEYGVRALAPEHIRAHAPDVGCEPLQGGLADGNEAFFLPFPITRATPCSRSTSVKASPSSSPTRMPDE